MCNNVEQCDNKGIESVEQCVTQDPI
jgi:hypothetical protein